MTYILQGDYGYGWDDLTASDTMAEAKIDLACYRANDTYSKAFRIVRRAS